MARVKVKEIGYEADQALQSSAKVKSDTISAFPYMSSCHTT
jgi:hypothetical protein